MPIASVTPYRIALSDEETKFSIRSSPSACVSCPFLIRRCPFLIRRKRSLLGEVRSIRQSFVRVQNLERAPPDKGARWMYGSHALACVLFGTREVLVLYLSSSHPLMSGGPDSWPDHYLTCNGSTGGVPDTDRMFSGRLLTRNAWKLMNNGCETVVHGTKLMTYIWQNLQLHRF